MVYRRCSYFQTPSSCVSGAVRITSTSWGSLPNDSIINQFYNYLQPLFLHLRMVCCIYCWTARVESISSKGSSTHWEKLAVFVPDLFDWFWSILKIDSHLVDFVWWSLSPKWTPPPSLWSSRSSTQRAPKLLWKGDSCKNINVRSTAVPIYVKW